jgi:hypothetical protein
LGPEAEELKFTSNVPSNIASSWRIYTVKRVKLPKAIVLLSVKGTTYKLNYQNQHPELGRLYLINHASIFANLP